MRACVRECVCVRACVRARVCVCVWCSVSRYVCACSREKSQRQIAIIPPPPHSSERIYATGSMITSISGNMFAIIIRTSIFYDPCMPRKPAYVTQAGIMPLVSDVSGIPRQGGGGGGKRGSEATKPERAKRAMGWVGVGGACPPPPPTVGSFFILMFAIVRFHAYLWYILLI